MKLNHVDRKSNLGGTNVLFTAMKSGDVDLYVEYTGTGLVNIMKEDSISDADKVYDIVKDYFEKEYGLNFNTVKGLDGELRYSSLESDETQVADAFSTDGLLKKLI